MNSHRKLETYTWRDAPACILGAGSTLLNYDFSRCDNCHMFSVNSSILKVNWKIPSYPDVIRVWISNDSLCRRWSYFSKVKQDICYKVVRDSWLKYADELEDFLFFKARKTREDIIDDDDDGLLYNSSVPSAIDLAIKLGFKSIFLFGIDHQLCDGKTHFWQHLPKDEQPKEIIKSGSKILKFSPARIMQPVAMQKDVWNMNVSVFNAIQKHADNHGVKIVNINNLTTTIPFAHKTLEETGLEKYGIKYMSIPKLPQG